MACFFKKSVLIYVYLSFMKLSYTKSFASDPLLTNMTQLRWEGRVEVSRSAYSWICRGENSNYI